MTYESNVIYPYYGIPGDSLASYHCSECCGHGTLAARPQLTAVKVKGLCPLTLSPECVCIPPMNGTRAPSNCGNSTWDQDDRRKEKGKCLIKTNCFLFCSKRGKKNFRLKLSLHACFHFGPLLSFQAVELKNHNFIFI